MMNYKVLMIDDQINDEAIKSFIKYARISGIDIIPCQYHEEGMLMLKEDKYQEIDAVILDATGFKNENDNLLANNGLRYSLNEISALAKNRMIPWFVFTGASRNNNDEFKGEIEYFQANIKFGRKDKVFYLKTIDEDLLISDIKLAIENIKETTIFYQYTPVFKALEGIPALDKHQTTLLVILKNLDSKPDYAQVRLIVESLFKALADINIIPEGFTEQKGWINGTSRFISGIHEDYDFHEAEFIHPTISETLFRVLNMVQDGSHNEGALKYKVIDYNLTNTSGYLYKSIVYGLLEILTYFGTIIKGNPNKELNQSRWKKKEIIKTEEVFVEAIFQSINDANWGTIKCIDGNEVSVHPKTIEQHNLAIDEKIWVVLKFIEEKNKYHIKNIKKNNG